ncbi:MAG: hypothetical protein WC445_00190 [Patescibacteria group bacterium]
MREGINPEREKERIRERFRSLEGMILRGGKQGEDAKKALFREFGSQVLGIIVELEREAKKKKR